MGKFLKFWGTRGSCPVSGAQFKQFGGNTSCLEIRYGDQIAIFDAGTGILPLGNQLLKEGIRKFHLFFSHLHWDHLIGFPFFKPLYRPDVEIEIFAPQGKGRTPKELLHQLFAEEFFPVQLSDLPAKIQFYALEPKDPIALGHLIIESHPAQHVYATYCFKVTTPKEVIGYVSDNEVKVPAEESFIDFFRGCDLLIHEMQYSEEEHRERIGWGHSSPHGILPLIEKIQPRRWIVTHHDPDHSDRDLKQFCRKIKKLLKENRMSCPVEWIHDEAVIDLQG